MKCNWHLCNNESEKTFCCRKCAIKAGVDKRRRKLKVMAIEHNGGKCQHCGYNKCIAALEFHHRNPTQKDFGLSNGNTYSWEKIKNEIEKCDLLCANCHRELHFEQDKSTRAG